MYVQNPAVLKWVFIPPFLKLFRQAKHDISWSYRLFKNITEWRNRFWHLISIEDSPGQKKKTNKKSRGKDEGLLGIRPYVTMTEITSLNSTIQDNIEFMLYIIRT